jgi:hypothetical protein
MREQHHFNTTSNPATTINPVAQIDREFTELLTKRNHLSLARMLRTRRIARGDRFESTSLLTISLRSVDRQLDDIRRAYRTGFIIRDRIVYTDGAHQRRGTRRGGGRTRTEFDIVDIRDGRIVATRTTRASAERFINRRSGVA